MEWETAYPFAITGTIATIALGRPWPAILRYCASKPFLKISSFSARAST
jgi:hypothetical protein